MFRDLEEGSFSMDESRTDDIPLVSDEENSHLTAPYTEEEVIKWSSKWNTTRPHDRIDSQRSSIRKIKMDLLDLFSVLHAGQLEFLPKF
jgi:hypothetical protein